MRLLQSIRINDGSAVPGPARKLQAKPFRQIAYGRTRRARRRLRVGVSFISSDGCATDDHMDSRLVLEALKIRIAIAGGVHSEGAKQALLRQVLPLRTHMPGRRY